MNIQERRAPNSRHRSRPIHINNFGQLSAPAKGPTLATPTSITSEISPTPLTDTKQQRLHPQASNPSLHWLNYTLLPADEAPCLTNSTNSLTDQIPPQHKHHRSAVSKTFTLTRSGSASVSPTGRSRESSDSSDNASGLQPRRQRVTTIYLTTKPPSTSTENNGVDRPSSLMPIGIQSKSSNKGRNSDDVGIILMPPHRTRPQPTNFISTTSCNFYTSNNLSRPPPPVPTTDTPGAAQLPPDGGMFVLSSS